VKATLGDSRAFPGLRKGFYVLVVGRFATQAEAHAALARLRRRRVKANLRSLTPKQK